MLLQFRDLGWAWLHDWVAYLVWKHSHIRHPVDCSLDKWEERQCCLWFSLYCTVAQVCCRGGDLRDKPSHINSCMEQELRLRGQKWQSYCLSKGYQYRLVTLRALLLGCVRFCATPWIVALQTLLSMGFPAKILEQVAISFSRGSSWPRDRTHISCIGKQFLTIELPGNFPVLH